MYKLHTGVARLRAHSTFPLMFVFFSAVGPRRSLFCAHLHCALLLQRKQLTGSPRHHAISPQPNPFKMLRKGPETRPFSRGHLDLCRRGKPTAARRPRAIANGETTTARCGLSVHAKTP